VSNNIYFASRRGPMKAIVAIEHAMLTAIWNMTTTGALYDDPGSDFYTRRYPDKASRRAIEQLRLMGYQVTLMGYQVTLEPTG
jgi:transposase